MQENVKTHSSDLAKHLRTIHFSLFVTCVGLITLTFLQSQNDIEKANQDIRRWREIQDRWNSDWFQNYAKKVVNGHLKNDTESKIMTRYVEHHYWTHRIALETRWTVFTSKLRPRQRPMMQTKPAPMFPIEKTPTFSKRDTLVLGEPQTLADVIVTWDDFSKPHYAYLLSSLADYAERLQPAVYKGSLVTTTSQPIPVVNIIDSLSNMQKPGGGSWSYRLVPVDSSYYLESAKTKHGIYFRIPANLSRVKLNAQAELRRMAKAESIWRLGKFDYAFPELYTFTKNITSISLEDIEAVLNNERQRKGKALQLFGFSLPTLFVTRWGMFIILGIQFYFMLHLLTFSRIDTQNEQTWVIPWIALYTDRQSRLTFLTTAFLLPVITCGILVFDGIIETKKYWNLVYFIPGLGVSILLALVSSRYIRNIWNNCPK